MVDVSAKPDVTRVARASGTITGHHLDDRVELKPEVREPAGALEVSSLSIKLSFTAPDKARDTLTLRGRVAIPAGFAPDGQPAAVSVGGTVVGRAAGPTARTFAIIGKLTP